MDSANDFMDCLMSCFRPSKEFMDIIDKPRNIIISKPYPKERSKESVYAIIDEIAKSTINGVNKNDHS